MKVHFIGIGGIGVSALARHFVAEGCEVTGSDVSADNLNIKGATVYNEHSAENIPDDLDLLIHTPAVERDNPEVAQAQKIGAKIQSYPEALGELTEKYYTIAVSGTHGKSTTTAMLSLIMIKAGMDPTVVIGTKMKEFGDSNYRRGESKYLLLEADEFKASFLNYRPDICVFTNIEEDHLDYYKDINDILDAFSTYISGMQEGVVIANKDDKNTRKLLNGLDNITIVWYGSNTKEEEKVKNYLSVPGKHNVYNGLAAFHAAKEMGADERDVLAALRDFKGSWRRFEEKDVLLKNGKEVRIINDYAHHPTELKATIEAAREKYPHKRIIAVFQPHQYQRSYRLFDKFKEALSVIPADKIFITDIYTVAGRESKEIMSKVSGKKMAESVKSVSYSGNLNETAEHLLKYLQEEDIVVIMGAGDIYKLEEKIIK